MRSLSRRLQTLEQHQSELPRASAAIAKKYLQTTLGREPTREEIEEHAPLFLVGGASVELPVSIRRQLNAMYGQ
jgi:hypothetical protein